VEELGSLTYDFVRWSPGLAVGAGYMASAAALVLLVLRRPELAREHGLTLLAVAGTTGYGIALLNYFVDRSAPHVLPYVSMPLLLAGALWLALVLRLRTGLPAGAVRGAVAFACGVAVLLVSVGWSTAGSRLEDSALVHLVPGGASTADALDRLAHFPPVNPDSVAGERALERLLPGESSSILLVDPDIGVETLMRSGRSNRLPIADAREDSFVPKDRTSVLSDAVAGLRPRERVLVDQGMLAALAAVRSGADPLAGSPLGEPSAPVQRFALEELDERFRLRPAGRAGGFAVLELEPR
jgi:hypothetical protein